MTFEELLNIEDPAALENLSDEQLLEILKPALHNQPPIEFAELEKKVLAKTGEAKKSRAGTSKGKAKTKKKKPPKGYSKDPEIFAAQVEMLTRAAAEALEKNKGP